MANSSQQTNTINTILTKLNKSKFTDVTTFEKLADVEEALSGQDKHLIEITELRAKINQENSTKFTNSVVAQGIINKYLNFIDYIIALINAKIAKDKAMTELLTNTFEGVDSFIKILDESKEELTSKNITEKILQNIGITDNDLKFKISNLKLNNAEKVGLNIDENQMIGRDSIKGLVTKIIENCQTKLTESIKGFTTQLDTIIKGESKTGGNGNPNTSNTGSFKNLPNDNLIVPDGDNLNKYQKSFKYIKENYEKGLEDNIIAYREICETLLSDGTDQKNPPGILKIIIDSVNGLNVVNNEITKRFGFKLDLFQNEPFADNKTAFELLKNEINAAKKELSNTFVRQNLQGTQGAQEEIKVDNNGNFIIGVEGITEIQQPLRHSFASVLYNLKKDESEDSGILIPYKNSLLDSLRKINGALVQSIKEENGKSIINKNYSNYYIAYDFGWKDNPTNTEDGEWSVKLGSKNPPDIIQEHITNLTEKYENSNNKKLMISNAINDMIELLQSEDPSIEKSASRGTRVDLRGTLESFKPKIPQQTDGGYKKKSKSKKMTSKRTSMKVAKKISSKEKEKENKNKNKKIVKSYSKSKSKKQSGGFIRGGVLFPQDFYDTSTVM